MFYIKIMKKPFFGIFCFIFSSSILFPNNKNIENRIKGWQVSLEMVLSDYGYVSKYNR